MIIEGYTSPLQEDDELNLTCRVVGVEASHFTWLYASTKGHKPREISQSHFYSKPHVRSSDEGQYTCLTSVRSGAQMQDSTVVEILKKTEGNHTSDGNFVRVRRNLSEKGGVATKFDALGSSSPNELKDEYASDGPSGKMHDSRVPRKSVKKQLSDITDGNKKDAEAMSNGTVQGNNTASETLKGDAAKNLVDVEPERIQSGTKVFGAISGVFAIAVVVATAAVLFMRRNRLARQDSGE